MALTVSQGARSFKAMWISILMSFSLGCIAFDQHPLKIQQDASSHLVEALYSPINNASRSWHVCVVLPNVSDAYWDPIKEGVMFEAKRVGVTASVYDARGYSEEGAQQQLHILQSRCQPSRTNAVVIAAVDGTRFFEIASLFKEHDIPIVDLINGLPSGVATSRIQVDHLTGGHVLGSEVKQYLESLSEPARNRKRRVLWVPGPLIAEWSRDTDQGFKSALSDVRHLTIDTFYLEPHFREQEVELRRQFENGQHYDVIVGTGVTAMAAVALKRKGIVAASTRIFSSYTSPEILELVAQGDVNNAVTDEPYMLGRLSIAVVVASLEGREVPRIIGTQSALLKKAPSKDEAPGVSAD